MIKLLKYELKQTWRMGITLVFSTLLGCMGLVLNPLNALSATGQLYIVLFTIVTIGSPFTLFIYNMVSFNQEFTRPQGYLMMTLPIKARDFILAKFTNQAIWNTLCFLIIAAVTPLIISRYAVLGLIQSQLNIIESIVFFLNGFIFHSLGALIIYFSVVLLSMEPKNNNRHFVKVILGLVLMNITSLLTNVFSVLIPFVIKGGFPTKGSVIIQLSEYMKINIQEFNVYNMIINVIMLTIFYTMTKKIIETRVQL